MIEPRERLFGEADQLTLRMEARRLDTAVDTANARLSRVEQVKAYTVLPAFWEPGSDEITPTMKLRRSVIAEKYAGEINALYERAWT
jgi:long-subunit acyl-CoA synthetase (AMP-forming)